MTAVIISGEEWLSQRLRRGLAQEGYESPPNHTVAPELARDFLGHAPEAELVVVVLPPDAERMVSLVADLRSIVQVPILAVGPASDARLVLRTLRSGASEYLDVEDLDAELEGGVRRHRSSAGGYHAGKILAIYGPCGGTGASSLAVNLAVALARTSGRTLLVDLQLTTGDLSALLDLKPAFTLAELGQHAGQLDRTLFHKSLAAHSSGVHLLAPPHSSADREYVQPEGVRQCLVLGRNLFSHVLVDVDRSCREISEAALRLADRVLVPLRLDFPCLRNTRRALDYLSEIGIGREVRVCRGQPSGTAPRGAPGKSRAGPRRQTHPHSARRRPCHDQGIQQRGARLPHGPVGSYKSRICTAGRGDDRFHGNLRSDDRRSTPKLRGTPVTRLNTLAPMAPLSLDDRFQSVKKDLHRQLVTGMDIGAMARLGDAELRGEVRRAAEQLCMSSSDLLSLRDRERLVNEVLDETFGLGPLEAILRDPTVTDILINGPACVYVERNGRLEQASAVFQNDQHLRQIVQRMVARVGRRVDETSPMVDALARR